MKYKTQPNHLGTVKTEPSEKEIRLRSYQIWEREGRPEGRAEEHWRQAKAELKVEMEEASMTGEKTDVVLPRLPISTPPHKIVSERIETDPLMTGRPAAAAGGK
jgi:hypothetical protein